MKHYKKNIEKIYFCLAYYTKCRLFYLMSELEDREVVDYIIVNYEGLKSLYFAVMCIPVGCSFIISIH